MCYNNKVKKKELDMKKENLNEYVKKYQKFQMTKLKLLPQSNIIMIQKNLLLH